jgi:endonuclease VIII
VAEGDTVHRTARRLQEWLDGRDLDRALAPSPLSPLRRQAERLASLEGDRLGLAEARGKHLLLHFSGGLVLHSHLGMRGLWRTRRRSEPWTRPMRSAWIVLSTVDREAAQFGGPRLALRREREIRLDPHLRALGPDILGEAFEPRGAVVALRRAAGGSERVGEVVVRQTAIAGIGNIYKSESLWEAELDPWRRLSEIDDEALERLLAAARRLMNAGVETGRAPRRVYRRAGAPCPRCGTTLRSRGQGDANRTTYWCPGCQRS